MSAEHTKTENIECPECGHSFSANQAFEDHIEKEAELIAERKISDVAKKYESKLQEASNFTEEQIEEVV